ncbi:MAG: thioesterase family protein [Bacteroidota bacterium]|nr:thioesterase family protein [Bacteroidota bacterium]
MIKHTTQIRVRYAETDQMNIVYYSNYFVYFESGRTELLRSIGLAYTELENMGYILPVIEANAKYFKPAAYDDLIDVITVLKELPTARIKLEYEVRNSKTNELIAEGYTVHSFVLSETHKPTRPPNIFLKLLESAFTDSRN